MELKDKVILITGSTHGIGCAMALEFAKHGAKVLLNGSCRRSARRRRQGHQRRPDDGPCDGQPRLARLKEEMTRMGRLERQRAEQEAMQSAVSSGETVYPSTGKSTGAAPRPRHSNNGIIVQGLDNCMVKFSKCCTPVIIMEEPT